MDLKTLYKQNFLVVSQTIGVPKKELRKDILSLKEQSDTVKYPDYSLMLQNIVRTGGYKLYYIMVMDKTEKVILQGPILPIITRDKND